MKKLLILTAAMLVVGASLASAAGVNLSWNKCNTAGATSAAAGLNYVNPGDGATGGLKLFQGSAKIDVAMNDFAGGTGVVDLGFDTPVPSFWGTVATGCNVGSMTIQNPSTSNVTTGGNTTVCPTNLFNPTVSGGGFGITFPTPNRMRLTIDYGQGNGGVVVNAGQLYAMFAIQMDMDAGVNNGCAGDQTPACIVLNSEEVDGFTVGEKNLVQTADVRNYITYNGGAVTGGCPAATPSTSSSWGKVKSLYNH